MNLFPDFYDNNIFSTIPLLGLYAETHFRFWIPFSRYFRREPELIFDTPWRLEPGQTPTIFLIVKDAHIYPVKLHRVEIIIRHNKHDVANQTWELDREITERQEQLEFTLSRNSLPSGEVEVIPILHYSVKEKRHRIEVDNYPGVAKPPLRIMLASERLPKITGWLAGDTHLHTALTNDQIEFGASLEQTRKGAQLLGMDFVAATDHSYDLDDLPHDYLQNDPELKKWKTSRQVLETMNSAHDCTILPGEEISVSNSRGATVHFLHYNDPNYFPGSGDSGDDWPKVRSQLSIDDVLSLRSKNTVSVGAHTAYQFPWIPRIFLNRGSWKARDHENPALDGVQILCGTPASSSFQDSRQLWIDALLKGQHFSAYGGSDGHGNFNRNWHMKLPLWSLGIHEDQIFAQSRTLLRSDSSQVDDLIQAMKSGRTALTTGPVGDLQVQGKVKISGIGDTLEVASGEALEIIITGLSSNEFGSEMDVMLFWGDLSRREESLLHYEVDLKDQFELRIPYEPEINGYLRMEITSEGFRWPGLFLSSPIWIEMITSS